MTACTRPLAFAGWPAFRTAAVACALVASVPLQASAQGVSDDVVRIGILGDQSGPYSDNGGQGAVAAAKMAIEDFGGKVLGKPIELIDADHQNKADVASAITNQWIDVRKVDMIADGAATAAALAVQQITRPKNKVFLLSSVASEIFTGKECSPTTIQWTWDTYGLPKAEVGAMVKSGGNTWYIISVDYVFGHLLERSTTQFVNEAGGKILGTVRHPLNNVDFSSFLLPAMASKANVIALANGGADLINIAKQAVEFGVTKQGQKLAAIFANIRDIDAIGLDVAQGMYLAETFYWDVNDKTRAWSKRFQAIRGHAPTAIQAGAYSAVLHYLKAVAAAGTDAGDAVTKKMKEIPVNDFYNTDVKVREDGRVMHSVYLLQVKSPKESTGKWDYYKISSVVPGDQAWKPMNEGGCPLVSK